MQTTSAPAQLGLIGASGTRYTFYVFPMNTQFKQSGGVYAVTRSTGTSGQGQTHHIVYIGQTGDLSERFDAHHKADCFRKQGSTHLCAMVDPNEESRLAIEADLIAAYNPLCNG
jgi:predicted GIY-YIG superfamily endonuclease